MWFSTSNYGHVGSPFVKFQECNSLSSQGHWPKFHVAKVFSNTRITCWRAWFFCFNDQISYRFYTGRFRQNTSQKQTAESNRRLDDFHISPFAAAICFPKVVKILLWGPLLMLWLGTLWNVAGVLSHSQFGAIWWWMLSQSHVGCCLLILLATFFDSSTNTSWTNAFSDCVWFFCYDWFHRMRKSPQYT